MELDSLRNDPLIIQWFNNINATHHTQLNYLQAIKQFAEYTNHAPEDLITEAEQEIQNGLLTRQRKLKGYMISFRKSLQDKGLADMTVQGRIAAVKSFYESFDITVPKLKGERRKAIPKECNIQLPTKTDLQECLKVCDLLERSVMLTGLSSGMASNEIRDVKLKQFLGGYDKVTGITTLHITRQKTQTRYITFLSPECSAAIWDYLKWRDRDTKAEGAKRQNQLAKQRTTETSYLFIKREVPDAYLKTSDEELRKMSENTVIKMYRSISEKASKNTEFGAYNAIRSHAMRKVFGSILTNNGCSEQVKEFLLGHTLDNTTSAYWFADTEKLKEQYQKYIPYLTIEKSLDVSTNPEYLQALERAEKAEAEAVRVSVERDEIQKLKDQLNSMTESFDSLWNMYQQDAKQQKPEAEKGFRKIRIIPSDLEPSRIEDFE